MTCRAVVTSAWVRLMTAVKLAFCNRNGEAFVDDNIRLASRWALASPQRDLEGDFGVTERDMKSAIYTEQRPPNR